MTATMYYDNDADPASLQGQTVRLYRNGGDGSGFGPEGAGGGVGSSSIFDDLDVDESMSDAFD